jgi:hypothetical protein
MYIINYCSGGLGNRLKPMGSCSLIAKQSNRELGIYWPSTMRCMGKFKNLFSNPIQEIDIEQLDPSEVTIYSDPSYIVHDANLNNLFGLVNLYNKIGCSPIEQIENIDTSKKYVIVYNNTILPKYEDISNFIKSLNPIQELNNLIKNFIEINQINKSVFGIHARSTDFTNSSIEPYKQFVDSLLVNVSNAKVLFCSDDPEWEAQMYYQYPNNIIIREKKDNVKKFDTNNGWTNNAHTSEVAVQEAIVDMYLLSKTNFMVYNKDSTFAHLVSYLK